MIFFVSLVSYYMDYVGFAFEILCHALEVTHPVFILKMLTSRLKKNTLFSISQWNNIPLFLLIKMVYLAQFFSTFLFPFIFLHSTPFHSSRLVFPAIWSFWLSIWMQSSKELQGEMKESLPQQSMWRNRGKQQNGKD